MENQHLKSCNQRLVEQVAALQEALEGKWASVCVYVPGYMCVPGYVCVPVCAIGYVCASVCTYVCACVCVHICVCTVCV